ncbi:MAG: UDP-N-acetylmuramate dehydrogenase [Lachnospiraceae bacterium]|nr:UDP-N-acetylmuramate dehydrogenase [Lachnospiraceae bacterium]
MWDKTLDSKLYKLIPEERILRDEPMYNHTTFRTGGPAARFLSAGNKDELISVLQLLRDVNVDHMIIGNGSNILVSDLGYDGLVIDTTGMTETDIDGDSINAEAGVMLGRLASAALSHDLSGLEFASGIPGTLGGAVYMNAGAYGGEMKDVIDSVRIYDTEADKEIVLYNKDMDFGYRHSIIKDRSYIMLSAKLKLHKGNHNEIEALMKDYNGRRRDKQPLEYPSAGSTFKRPEGFYAGALIEESGLKGYSVGDAAVSEKHAGFVINRGKASSADIHRLICEVREKVYADTGVRLEPEVVFLGEF